MVVKVTIVNDLKMILNEQNKYTGNKNFFTLNSSAANSNMT